MKEAELRAAATCAHCQKKFGEAGSPMFYRVKIERHLVNQQALLRHAGLEVLLGSPKLASVMGLEEEFTENIMEDAQTITICETCSTANICVAQLAEYAARKEPDGQAQQG